MVRGLPGTGGRGDPLGNPGKDLSAKTEGIRASWEVDPSHLDPPIQVLMPSLTVLGQVLNDSNRGLELFLAVRF